MKQEVCMSSEEVKTENSSQEVKTEAKTYSDEQFKGLLADKQAEVRKRQDAEKQIADLQRQGRNAHFPLLAGKRGNR